MVTVISINTKRYQGNMFIKKNLVSFCKMSVKRTSKPKNYMLLYYNKSKKFLPFWMRKKLITVTKFTLIYACTSTLLN